MLSSKNPSHALSRHPRLDGPRPSAADESSPPIVVRDIWKSYRVGADRSLLRWLKRRLGKTPPSPTFWALKGISFNVQPGESMGVVGKNGAGKSTLLKVLSGVTEPSRGDFKLRGRVAPLIEIGAGFHPELTGRENIYLNAGIMGLSRRETRSRVEEIIEFAELDEFIETPVKRYSSGMLARLGFSISVLIDPDVLLVDEVLSVGDIGFVLKSYRKIEEIRGKGVPVVLVSHNLQLIRNFCDRALWLPKGEVAAVGRPHEVCAQFVRSMLAETTEAMQRAGHGEDVYRVHSDPSVAIDSVRFLDRAGRETSDFETGDAWVMEIHLRSLRATDQLIFAVTVWQEETGQVLINHNNVDDGVECEGLKGPGSLVCRIHLGRLQFVSGLHRVSISVSEGQVNRVCDWHERMYPLRIAGGSTAYGAFHAYPDWRFERV